MFVLCGAPKTADAKSYPNEVMHICSRHLTRDTPTRQILVDALRTTNKNSNINTNLPKTNTT